MSSIEIEVVLDKECAKLGAMLRDTDSHILRKRMASQTLLPYLVIMRHSQVSIWTVIPFVYRSKQSPARVSATR